MGKVDLCKTVVATQSCIIGGQRGKEGGQERIQAKLSAGKRRE